MDRITGRVSKALILCAGLACGVSMAGAPDRAVASFKGPTGVAVDGAGNVYVADYYNDTIRKISPAGRVTTLAGAAGSVGYADGLGESASFDLPFGVATDRAGNVYVADTWNNAIRKITPAGLVTTVAGRAGVIGHDDGTGAAASFRAPHGINLDRAGNIYVADAANNSIRRITPAGAVTTLAGVAGEKGDADGVGAAARFSRPVGITADKAGNLYVADTNNNSIRKIGPAGRVTTLAGGAAKPVSVHGAGAGVSFHCSGGIAIDRAGNVYASDAANSVIYRITPAGVVTLFAGIPGLEGHADGARNKATFRRPLGLATDGAGNVYVADAGNSTIRRITAAGRVTTLAGTARVEGHADGGRVPASGQTNR